MPRWRPDFCPPDAPVRCDATERYSASSYGWGPPPPPPPRAMRWMKTSRILAAAALQNHRTKLGMTVSGASSSGRSARPRTLCSAARRTSQSHRAASAICCNVQRTTPSPKPNQTKQHPTQPNQPPPHQTHEATSRAMVRGCACVRKQQTPSKKNTRSHNVAPGLCRLGRGFPRTLAPPHRPRRLSTAPCSKTQPVSQAPLCTCATEHTREVGTARHTGTTTGTNTQ